jgi:hypothetical protein
MMGGIGRRVVTGQDSRGRSRAVRIDAPRMRGISAELWRSDADLGAAGAEASIAALEPPAGGSVFRFFRVMPEHLVAAMPEEAREQLYAEHFAHMGASHCRPDTQRHPGMHRTASIDYVMLLEGRVTLLLDEGEVELEPFDVVVQRATNHAWVNHGDSPALLMAVLIDHPGRPGPDSEP